MLKLIYLRLLMNPVIIFDFDGTLADTFHTIWKVSSRLSVEFRFKIPSWEESEELKNLNTWQLIQYSQIHLCKLPSFFRKLKDELNKEMERVGLFAGVREMILELKERGYQLGIITSNSSENVKIVMENYQLQESFSFVYSEKIVWGKHRVIKHWLKESQTESDHVIYVGDERRDILAARRANIKMIAVTWGFNTKEILMAENPDGLIDSPQQLMGMIQELTQVQS